MQETYQRTAAEFLLEVHEEGAQVADSWESMLPLHYAVQNRVRHPSTCWPRIAPPKHSIPPKPPLSGDACVWDRRRAV